MKHSVYAGDGLAYKGIYLCLAGT